MQRSARKGGGTRELETMDEKKRLQRGYEAVASISGQEIMPTVGRGKPFAGNSGAAAVSMRRGQQAGTRGVGRDEAPAHRRGRGEKAYASGITRASREARRGRAGAVGGEVQEEQNRREA